MRGYVISLAESLFWLAVPPFKSHRVRLYAMSRTCLDPIILIFIYPHILHPGVAGKECKSSCVRVSKVLPPFQMGHISGLSIHQWSAFYRCSTFHVVFGPAFAFGESYAAQLFGLMWVFTLVFDTNIGN